MAWDRDPDVRRHGAATGRASSRPVTGRPSSAQIDAPTLVIHGDRDRMVHPTGGAATARAIPGARLETIPGMGHDLPFGAWGRLLDLITAHVIGIRGKPGAVPTTPPRSEMSRSARHVISGRTVVITGAASGIGRALAQRLSAHGCPVAIADVDEAG